jgi:hypothetical protein
MRSIVREVSIRRATRAQSIGELGVAFGFDVGFDLDGAII